MLQVSKNAATVGGTSAKLKTGDVLSIWDLLHGLMLPSGNDAGIVMAEHFG
jgi:D-alanyl-D-alanine carboxypeptidase (penicillin-binding protein 5/6)